MTTDRPVPPLRRRALLAAAAATTAAPAWVRAQGAAPLRLVVPYPAGGPLDLVARSLAEQVRSALGTVIVENRPGAGGNLGADVVAKSAPDGRTLVMGAVATHAINPWLYQRMPYDAQRDFTPVVGVAQVPNVLVVQSEVAERQGWTSLAALVAAARRQPGRLNYGSGGNGSAGHLAGELFKSQAGLFIVHIPYAGGNAAQLALLAGQIDLTFDNLASAAANIRAGRLRALAVTTARRASAMPDVPTVAEAGRDVGLAQFDIHTWFGLFGPAKLPAEITQRLNHAFADALRTPELKTRLASLMAEPMGGTPEQFAAFVRAENVKYEALVKRSGAKID